jgi:glycosyltransferase involved in cell wall biosynthesis
MEELVSVIIPVYKVEKFLARCIDSVLNQTYKNLEIILVNDGSPDNSLAICRKYAKSDTRIKIIDKKNGGLSSARNAGLDLMNGRYVCFVDSDDVIVPDFVETLYNLSLKYNSLLVQCECEHVYPTTVIQDAKHILDYKKTAQEIFLSKSREFSVRAWDKFYHESLFSDLRFPEGIIYEDDVVAYKILYKAREIVITSRRLYYYYQTNDSIMRNSNKYVREDFIGIYKDQISFFETRNETELVDISKKELAIRLMLCYIKCKANKSNTNDKEALFKAFKFNYSSINNTKLIFLKEKIIMKFFRLAPNLFSWIENSLDLRMKFKIRRKK